jgi:hypothetical protein
VAIWAAVCEPLRVLWRLGYPRLVSSVGVL